MKRVVLNLIIVIIAVSAVFTCKKDNDEAYIVSGVISSPYISNWADVSVSVSFDEGETWSATAKILKGEFSIKLPMPDERNLETISSVFPDGLNTSDNSVKICEAKFFVRKDDQKGVLVPYTVGYFYVDKDLLLLGTHVQTFVEGKMSSTSIYELALRKGWNVVVYEFAEQTPTDHSTKYIYTTHQSPAPSDVVWLTYVRW